MSTRTKLELEPLRDSTHKMNIRIPSKDKEFIQTLANENNLSMTRILLYGLELIREEIKTLDKEKV